MAEGFSRISIRRENGLSANLQRSNQPMHLPRLFLAVLMLLGLPSFNASAQTGLTRLGEFKVSTATSGD